MKTKNIIKIGKWFSDDFKCNFDPRLICIISMNFNNKEAAIEMKKIWNNGYIKSKIEFFKQYPDGEEENFHIFINLEGNKIIDKMKQICKYINFNLNPGFIYLMSMTWGGLEFEKIISERCKFLKEEFSKQHPDSNNEHFEIFLNTMGNRIIDEINWYDHE